MRIPVQLSGVGLTLALASSAFGQSGTIANGGAITIPSGPGNATPYPSVITIPAGGQGPGTLTDVNVSVSGLSHTWCSDIDMVVVGPTGVACMLLGDRAGSADPVAPGNYTFDQAAAAEFPTAAPLTPGTYRPGNTGAGDAVLPAPFPAVPVVTVPAWNASPSSLNGFNGTNGNGNWSLYIIDQAAGDSGVVSGGWSVTLTPYNDCILPLPHPWCINDVNNDTVVGVGDMLAVIGNWGQVGPARPVGDIAPGLFGDCTVGVADLLGVIGQWGNCPPATGACCAAAGTCTPQTATDCATAGGTFNGVGSSCGVVVCPVVPANDNPGGAFTLVGGVHPAQSCNAGTTTNATLTAGVANPICTFGGQANFTRDVWFKYTVPTAGGVFGQILRVDTCANVAPFTDTVIAAYTGTVTPLAMTEVACGEDAGAGCGISTLLSRMTTPIIPAGQTVYIRLGSWGAGATNQGAYTLCASIETITQDNCVGAELISLATLPASDSDFLNNATQDFAPVCGTVGAGQGKWYKFQGTGNAIEVNTCGSTSQIYDGRVAVYCAGALGCGAMNCVAAANIDPHLQTPQPFPCGAWQGERVRFCTNAASTYYVLVSVEPAGLPGGVTGTYTVTFTQHAAGCPVEVPALPNLTVNQCNAGSPPPNDDCALAVVVPVGATLINNATSTPQTGGVGTVCGQPWSKDIWHRYTSANGGTVTVALSSTPVWDSVIEVYNGIGCAPFGTIMGCVDDTGGVGVHGTMNFTAVAGSTYLIRVTSWQNTAGNAATLTITDP